MFLNVLGAKEDMSESDLKLLAGVVRRIVGVDELSELEDATIPWDRVVEDVMGKESMAAFHGFSIGDFQRLWITNWERRCRLYEKPPWTWEDSEKLVDEIGRQESEGGCGMSLIASCDWLVEWSFGGRLFTL